MRDPNIEIDIRPTLNCEYWLIQFVIHDFSYAKSMKNPSKVCKVKNL